MNQFLNINLCRAAMMALILFTLAACGGAEDEEEQDQVEPLACEDEKTEVRDGLCVLKDHDCDGKQIITPLGECLPQDTFCGQDTIYDSATQNCIPASELECGPGTIEDGGACVLENPLTCGPGTVLADGECRLASDVCGPGTELDAHHCHPSEGACDGRSEFDVSSGQCVDLDTVECGADTTASENRCIPQRTIADEFAANANIDHSDNQPIIPVDDDPFIFTGTFDEALIQRFELHGTEGQWLEITIYPRGLPSPGLTLIGGNNWERSVLPGLTSTPKRTVIIPADATYELTVNSTFSADDPDAFTSEDWQYVGIVEVIDTPVPYEWEDYFVEPLAGQLANTTHNFIEIDPEDMEVIVLTPSNLGTDVENPTVEIWNSPTEFSERHSLQVGQQIQVDPANSSPLYLHFDATYFVGARTTYQTFASEPILLEPGQFHSDEVSADAGQVIFLAHTNNEGNSVAASVYLDGELKYSIDSIKAANDSFFGSTTTRREFFYAPEDGTYLVDFENTSSSDRTNFVSQNHVEDVPTFHVPLPEDGEAEFEHFYPVDNVFAGDWTFALIDTPSAGHFDVSYSTGTGSVYYYVFDTDRNQLMGATPNSFQFTAPDAGVYFVVLRPWSSSTAITDISLEITGRAVDTLGAGETIEQTFEAEAFDLLHGSISYEEQAPLVRLLNPNDQVIFEEIIDSDEFYLMELLPGPGEYTLQVENTSDSPILDIAVVADVTAPAHLLNKNDHFSESYTLNGLEAGESHFIVLRSQIDLLVGTSAHIAEDEDATLRVWDMDNRELLSELEGTEFFDLPFLRASEGSYAIELQANTDLADDIVLNLEGEDVIIVDEQKVHAPLLYVEQIGEGNGIETSDIVVNGCAEVADISVTFNYDSGLATYRIVDLYAPGASEPVRLHNKTSGNDSMTFPDPDEPVETLDSLLGTFGNGTWTLRLDNTAQATPSYFESWSLSLLCVE